MKFLSNTYDPKKEDAKYSVIQFGNETLEEAWQSKLKWLSDKVIGYPQQTQKYTVEQLKEQGYVGVYQK